MRNDLFTVLANQEPLPQTMQLNNFQVFLPQLNQWLEAIIGDQWLFDPPTLADSLTPTNGDMIAISIIHSVSALWSLYAQPLYSLLQ